ncbi:MAG: hypothetical protein IBV53_07215 [Candidatus Atribacteria bacterium]
MERTTISNTNSLLFFNIILTFYFCYIYAASNIFDKLPPRIQTILLAYLTVSIVLTFTFIIFQQKNEKLKIVIHKENLMIILLIIGYYSLMIISFIFKSPESRVRIVLLFISLTALFCVFFLPLSKKIYLYLFNIIILVVQLYVLYFGLINVSKTVVMYSGINVFFSSTNGLAHFAIVNCAYVFLSYGSFIRNNKNINSIKDKIIFLLISFNIFISLVIIILSMGRGTIFAFALMLLYLIYSALFLKKRELYVFFKFIIICFLILFIFINLSSSIKFQVLEYFSGVNKYSFQSVRFGMWKEFLNRPDLSYLLIFGEDKIFLSLGSKWGYTQHLHNSYLEIIRNMGIFPVVFIFFAIFILLFKAKRFSFFKNNIFATAILILIFTASFFEDDFLWGTNYDFLAFWSLLQCSKRY